MSASVFMSYGPECISLSFLPAYLSRRSKSSESSIHDPSHLFHKSLIPLTILLPTHSKLFLPSASSLYASFRSGIHRFASARRLSLTILVSPDDLTLFCPRFSPVNFLSPHYFSGSFVKFLIRTSATSGIAVSRARSFPSLFSALSRDASDKSASYKSAAIFGRNFLTRQLGIVW